MEIQDKCKLNQTGAYTRNFNLDKDYQDIKGWFEHFKKKDVHCPLPDMLSSDGIITEYYNQKVCAGFLYTTNSNIAMIEFMISNPEAPTKLRKESLKKTLTALKTKGYEILLNITSNRGYSRTLERYGYIRGTTPHYENVKILWQQEH
jgi:hypothetical protein